MRFSVPMGSSLVSEYHPDTTDYSLAVPVKVSAGATVAGIDASLASGASITGHVTDGNNRPVQGVSVWASTATPGGGYGSTMTDANGDYVISGLVAGDYRVQFMGPMGSNLMGEYHPDTTDYSSAVPVKVSAGASVAGIDASLATGASITGKVTDDHGHPLQGVNVSATSTAIPAEMPRSAISDVNGVYVITGLAAGDYRVQFSPPYNSTLAPEFYSNANAITSTLVALTAGGIAEGIDARLEPGGMIAGRVTDGSGNPVSGAGVYVSAWSTEGVAGGFIGWTSTDADGHYVVGKLAAGTYRVWVSAPYGSLLAPEFLTDASSPNNASLVTVSAGATSGVTDVQLDVGGTMSGRVVDSRGNPVVGVAVGASVTAEGIGGQQSVFATTDAEGRYRLAGLATGDYVVGFYPSLDSGLKPEFFRNRINAAEAVSVSVTAGAETTNTDAVLGMDGPVALPGAPTDVVAAPGDSQATITWGSPQTGGPAQSYIVTAAPGGRSCETSALSCTVDGLANGTAYTFSVVGINDAGSGPTSQTTTAITPVGVPSAPLALVAMTAPAADLRAGEVQLTWQKPTTDGGSALVDYVVQQSPDGINDWVTLPADTSTAASYIVRGLASGGTFSFRVAARNSIGQGPATDVVTANVPVNRYQLSVARVGAGMVTSTPSGIDCGTTCDTTLDQGTLVELSAAPAAGWTFTGWSGACTGKSACSVTMDGAKSVTAQFTLTGHKLSVSRAGTGSGTVSSTPSGIDCGTTCTATLDRGTTVVLKATPSAGSTFAGWSGACTGKRTCSVTMTAAKSVAATFKADRYTLSVSRSGTGSGSVSSAPSGIDCGKSCKTTLDHGAMVVLTAIPATGSTFAGWSGACTGKTACSVTMTAAKSVTATFTVQRYMLSVSRAGTGSGTVSSDRSRIDCGKTCDTDLDHGATIVLRATPAAGSTFAGWSGACTGKTTCSVTMTAAKSVTATFTRR